MTTCRHLRKKLTDKTSPLILITNDDGIQAPGLAALAAAMQTIGRAMIIAPEHDNSAASHSLTMSRPLRVRKINEKTYAVNGTPTDCVMVGIGKILGEKPALIVSGINPGGNLGDDISYSGTVSAAVEGTMLGIHSMAVSMAGDKPFRFEIAADFAARTAKKILDQGLPRDTLLNINVPNLKPSEIAGVKFTRQGRRGYEGAIKETFDPWGRQHYWIGGGEPVWENGDDTDSCAVHANYISISPIHLDLTNYEALAHFRTAWQDLNKT